MRGHRLASGRRTAAIVLSITLLAGFATACGDDDDQGGAADATDDATAGAEGGEQVLRIGVIAPLDDGLTAFGHGIENSVLAVDQANEEETIEGWEIEVLAEDDSSEPEIGAEAAETVAADDSVIGVVGTYNSGVASEVAPVLNDAGIAMISPANTDATLTLGRTARTRPARSRTTSGWWRATPTRGLPGGLRRRGPRRRDRLDREP